MERPVSVHGVGEEQVPQDVLEVFGHPVLLLLAAVVLYGQDQRVGAAGEGIR